MKKLDATTVLFLMAAVAVQADVVSVDYSQTEADYDAIESSEVVAAFVFRAGSSTTTWELNSGDDLDSLTDPKNITWTKNGEQGFNLLYDSNTGNASLSITEVGGPVITTTTEPLSWFNEVWIVLDINFAGHALSLSNTVVDQESIKDLEADWDANRFVVMKINLGNTPGNINDFNLASVLSTDTRNPGLGSFNDFRGEILFVQNPDLEAEVTPIELGSFTYDQSSGDASLTLQAAPNAAYVLKQSTDPGDFTSATIITPSAVTTGTLNGTQITTDATGKAVIQFNLGTAPRMFVRGERP
jgi:hypothetical protein